MIFNTTPKSPLVIYWPVCMWNGTSENVSITKCFSCLSPLSCLDQNTNLGNSIRHHALRYFSLFSGLSNSELLVLIAQTKRVTLKTRIDTELLFKFSTNTLSLLLHLIVLQERWLWSVCSWLGMFNGLYTFNYQQPALPVDSHPLINGPELITKDRERNGWNVIYSKH